MRILITGNMGYVEPSVVSQLRPHPSTTVTGLATGYLSHCLPKAAVLPECNVDVPYFAHHE